MFNSTVETQEEDQHSPPRCIGFLQLEDETTQQRWAKYIFEKVSGGKQPPIGDEEEAKHDGEGNSGCVESSGTSDSERGSEEKSEDSGRIIQTSALNRKKACVKVSSRRSDCAESSDEAEDSGRRTKAISALKKRDNEREVTGKNKCVRRTHPKIGAVVRTWWPKDNAWYQGRIIAIHKSK